MTMDLYAILKKFKDIRPDEQYTLRSRSSILAGPLPVRRPTGVWHMLIQSLEYGSAIAIASLLFVAVLGGVSAWHFLSPLQLQSLDPAALQAEAEAVDTQLELSRIYYTEHAAEARALTLEAAPSPTRQAAEEQATEMGLAPASSSPEPSVDEALQLLSE